MAKLFKVTLLVQTDEDPAEWIYEKIADVLDDDEKLLTCMGVETTLESELNP
jgi:hypothetical protein